MVFNIKILGCGSATPTVRRNPTAQIVNAHERHILIDCGEGTQLQMRKFGVKFQKINHVLISHLHGDHYLGLVGLISTFALLGRKKDLHIYGPEALGEIIFMQLRASKSYLTYHIEFHSLSSDKSELIFEDDYIKIKTIPLKHRVYCNGFLIEEKPLPLRLNIHEVEKNNIPIAWYHRLKRGEDYIKENGELIPNNQLTLPPYKVRKYAFCSDTSYLESIIPIIKGVDLLYHEATFLSAEQERARQTFHSTIIDACTIAKKAEVNQLLVGHYSARYKTTDDYIKQAQPIFKNTTPVEDGDEFSIDLR